MKFFESKYFVSTHDVRMIKGDWGWENYPARAATAAAPASKNVPALLSAYLCAIPIVRNHITNVDKVKSEWEEVEDMREYNSMMIDDYDSNRCSVWFNKELEVFAYCSRFSRDEEQRATFWYPLTRDPHNLVKQLMEQGYFIPKVEEYTPTISVLVKTDAGFCLQASNLPKIDIDFDTMYPDDFKEVSEVIVDNLTEESSPGLFVLHGAPGTGKTSYIKWLTTQSPREFVYLPAYMVTHVCDPSFITFFLAHQGITFIIEDAEEALGVRGQGRDSAVSALLNLTNGILGDLLNCQFICTFNTDLDNIDQALLRPGRLIARYEFGELSVEQANRYLESVGSEERVRYPSSLGHLMNISSIPVNAEVEKPKKSFGFV